MMKFIVLCSFVIATAAALKLHEYGHGGGEHHEYEHLEYAKQEEPKHEETEHHQEVEHKHATSHQSVKFHHYHAVPVYIKKEDQHLIKKPVEIGGTKQKLKILHPETEKNYNHGLVLEEHSESKFHEQGHHEEPHHYEHYHHHE